MPEGHTVHKLARDLARDLKGTRVRASSPQGRFEQGASAVDGKPLRAAEAWGKHLFLDFPHVPVHVHLGLFGRFRRRKSPAEEPRPTTRLRLAGEKWTWDLSGPTICEIVTPDGREHVLARLGTDPLRADADPQRFLDRVRRSRRAIGALLLDQSVLAGVGNVYRAELLFLAGLRPSRRGSSISRTDLERLWDITVQQLRRGVRLGRIVTTEEDRPPRGERLWVYKRSQCRSCDGRIRRTTLANRATWFCPACQR